MPRNDNSAQSFRDYTIWCKRQDGRPPTRWQVNRLRNHLAKSPLGSTSFTRATKAVVREQDQLRFAQIPRPSKVLYRPNARRFDGSMSNRRSEVLLNDPYGGRAVIQCRISQQALDACNISSSYELLDYIQRYASRIGLHVTL